MVTRKNGATAVADDVVSVSVTPTIQLPELQVVNLHMEIRGTSSLITHKWADKAIRQMLDKQMKKAAAAKEAKDPEQDYRNSLYIREDGSYGFPSVAFKSAAVRAGTYADMKMTFLRGAFHVPGELVKIDGEPHMREDVVRLNGLTADIRYRGEFDEWSAVIPVELNERSLSVEQLLNLFKVAGFAVGIGEWRPEKDGQHGRFEVLGVKINR